MDNLNIAIKVIRINNSITMDARILLDRDIIKCNIIIHSLGILMLSKGKNIIITFVIIAAVANTITLRIIITVIIVIIITLLILQVILFLP